MYERLVREVKGQVLKRWVILGHIKAEACDLAKSIDRVQAHLKWREALLKSGENDWKVSEFLPNRVHKKGLWIIQMGEIKIGEMLSELTP